jgi:hypothetical protein
LRWKAQLEENEKGPAQHIWLGCTYQLDRSESLGQRRSFGNLVRRADATVNGLASPALVFPVKQALRAQPKSGQADLWRRAERGDWGDQTHFNIFPFLRKIENFGATSAAPDSQRAGTSSLVGRVIRHERCGLMLVVRSRKSSALLFQRRAVAGEWGRAGRRVWQRLRRLPVCIDLHSLLLPTRSAQILTCCRANAARHLPLGLAFNWFD